MATYNNVVFATHQTLVASTVDTVNLTLRHNHVEVVNRGSTEIYFTTTGATPTVGGADEFVCPPNSAITAPCGAPFEPLPNLDSTLYTAPNNPTAVTAATAVKLISSGTPAYTVTGL